MVSDPSAVPLRIDWTLTAPMVYPEKPLHLDALIAWAFCDEADVDGKSDPRGEALLARLPLEHHRGNAGWCWCASRLRFSWDAPPWFVPWVRRQDVDVIAATQSSAWVGSTNQLNLGTGPYRGHFGYESLGWARYATAWALGDPQRIEALLDRVKRLGRRRATGMGEIASMIVVADDTAREQWRDRVMPDPAPGYAPVIERLRPPYYSPDERVLAYMPREPAVLDLAPTEEVLNAC